MLGFIVRVALLFVFSGAVMAGPDDPSRAVREKLAADPGNRNLLAELRSVVPRLTNQSDRVNCMTIYALGCMEVGDTEAGEAVRAYLLKKFSADPDTEYLSDSSITSACGACSGMGSESTTCAACDGRGHILSKPLVTRSYYRMLGIELPASSVPPEDPVADPASFPKVDTMEGYVAAVKHLRALYKSGRIRDDALANVISDPSKYVGQVVRARVYVISYHLRAVTVSPDPGPDSKSRAMLYPDTVWIGSKAGQLQKKLGNATAVIAVFGQLNAEQNVLFEVEEIEGE
ncbi:MAG: hypothetical protein QGH15_19365 [Kiritimatiellia bacterium]|jgi:hypothetical protein|nr:hypothetical protein [Kiritimatiellia bacterium]